MTAPVAVTSAVAERIRAAYDAGSALRIVGAGTWLDAGRPTRPAETLSLAADRGIVEYVPGDLTLTARAGTPLADIVSAAREHDQWLPLDPWGGDDGTLGATLSTATAGPHAYAMGLPRDAVLGMEFVTGTGTVVRSGGRVVKNVAGFDLTRLLTGSWGTLGVITEATVRLSARPSHARSILLRLPDNPDLSGLAIRLRALPFLPLASELVSASLASQLGLEPRSTLICRVGGNAKSVQAQLDTVRELGSMDDLADDIWPRLRRAGESLPASWRWSHLPSRFGDLWQAAERLSRDVDLIAHGNPARGVLRLLARAAANGAPALARATSAIPKGGTVVIDRLPRDAWPHAPVRVAGDMISRAIRQKFDPRGILNAGILGEHWVP